MNIKKGYSLLIIVIFISKFTFSQSSIIDTTRSCSKLIARMSYYWKLDSFANNGFRLYAYKELLKCKIDELNRSYLLDKFGKPNVIKKTNKGTEYFYFYYDGAAMPKKFNSPPEKGYISFTFGEYDKFLLSIDEGAFNY